MLSLESYKWFFKWVIKLGLVSHKSVSITAPPYLIWSLLSLGNVSHHEILKHTHMSMFDTLRILPVNAASHEK